MSQDYKVKDIKLSEFGRKEISLAETEMPGLMALRKEYKNKKPIIPFADRMEIVSSLEFVDEVVVQSHRDKIKQYHEIGFDVMFVGDDWKGDPLFEAVEKELLRFGVSIEYFKYTKHVNFLLFGLPGLS